MKIGIDATWAGIPGAGTGTYTDGLVRSLLPHRDHNFVLYFRPGDERHNGLFGLDGPNVERRVVGGWRHHGRTLIGLSQAAKADGLDLFHSPGFMLPLWRGPKIATFHDANMFLQWDKWWRTGRRVSWLALCGQTVLAAALASHIVTDSRSAAHDLQRALRIPSHRLSVLYPGVSDAYFQAPDGDAAWKIREAFGLDRYFLFVSVLSPLKNIEGVIRAFSSLAHPELTLALVGKEDGTYFRKVIEPLINSLGLAERVKILGLVPSKALPGLYRGAEALVYPSFAEGFGLPPLEAMASGTAVIASNRSSMPEVLDGAALLVDPNDWGTIAAAMLQVLTDPSNREELIKRGRTRAEQFRWSAAARRALSIYASVAAGGGT